MRIQFDENAALGPNGTVCDKDQYLNQSFPFRVFYTNQDAPRQPITADLRPTKDEEQCSKSNLKKSKHYLDKSVSNIIEYVNQEYGYQIVSNVALNDDDGQSKWLTQWLPPNEDDFVYIFKHGFYCILHQVDCMFDNRDTYYSWNGQDQILTDDEFYLVVGLNHNNFSLSTMNSISLASVTNPDNGNAFEIIDTVTNQEYEQFDLSDLIQCDTDSCVELEDVFAVQIGRPDNCLNTTVIPSICPDVDVLAAEERFIFFGEATLNPVTKTMPDQDCMVEWRLLKFSTLSAAPSAPTQIPTQSPSIQISHREGKDGRDRRNGRKHHQKHRTRRTAKRGKWRRRHSKRD